MSFCHSSRTHEASQGETEEGLHIAEDSVLSKCGWFQGLKKQTLHVFCCWGLISLWGPFLGSLFTCVELAQSLWSSTLTLVEGKVGPDPHASCPKPWTHFDQFIDVPLLSIHQSLWLEGIAGS